MGILTGSLQKQTPTFLFPHSYIHVKNMKTPLYINTPHGLLRITFVHSNLIWCNIHQEWLSRQHIKATLYEVDNTHLLNSLPTHSE
jgi:hypothetical protein